MYHNRNDDRASLPISGEQRSSGCVLDFIRRTKLHHRSWLPRNLTPPPFLLSDSFRFRGVAGSGQGGVFAVALRRSNEGVNYVGISISVAAPPTRKISLKPIRYATRIRYRVMQNCNFTVPSLRGSRNHYVWLIILCFCTVPYGIISCFMGKFI